MFSSFRRMPFHISAGVLMLFGMGLAQDTGKGEFTGRKSSAIQPTTQQSAYMAWLNEDARWIAEPEERAVFRTLKNDHDRQLFIQNFWLRRDPTPDTFENEFEDEHYRRILFANEQYTASGIPGWKTDRGRIYITYGPPDSIEPHAASEANQRPPEEGGGTAIGYAYEVWRYRYIPGIGTDVEIEFVDDCSCGLYAMAMDRSKKDAIIYIPNRSALSTGEKHNRTKDGSLVPDRETLRLYLHAEDSRDAQFKDLEAILKPTSKGVIARSQGSKGTLPLVPDIAFKKATNFTTLVLLTLKPGQEAVNALPDQPARLNVLVMVRDVHGQVVKRLEDVIEPSRTCKVSPGTLPNLSSFIPLHPGTYLLQIATKNYSSGRIGSLATSITVPDYP